MKIGDRVIVNDNYAYDEDGENLAGYKGIITNISTNSDSIYPVSVYLDGRDEGSESFSLNELDLIKKIKTHACGVVCKKCLKNARESILF